MPLNNPKEQPLPMNNEIAFCEQHCKPLTDAQKRVLKEEVKMGNFLGVGRGLGSTRKFPLIRANKSKYIIMETGHRLLAAVGDQLLFDI